MDRRKFLKSRGLSTLGSVDGRYGLPISGGQMVPGCAADDCPSQSSTRRFAGRPLLSWPTCIMVLLCHWPISGTSCR